MKNPKREKKKLKRWQKISIGVAAPFVAIAVLLLVLLICELYSSYYPGPVAMRPAIMYQGNLFLEEGLSDKDLKSADMTYIGEIVSLIPSHEMPKEDWQGNYETLLNGKAYLSIDGTLHLLLSNGRQIEMTRSTTNAPVTTDMPEPTQATIDALNITTQVVEAVIDPKFNAEALFKRLEGYWNTEIEEERYTLRSFIRFHYNEHNDDKPSLYRGIWEAEGSDTGELIGGRSTGENIAELVFLFPTLSEDGELPGHPELTAVVSIDFGGIDSGGEITMKLNNYSALGNGAWHTYTFGGMTMAETEAQAFAVRPPVH